VRCLHLKAQHRVSRDDEVNKLRERRLSSRDPLGFRLESRLDRLGHAAISARN
jgi:hypothetical protein